MASATTTGHFTFEEFCALIRDDQRADLIDGVIYMASPENLETNDVFVWLLTLVRIFVDSQKLGGKIFASRVAFWLGDGNGPEPDIAYVGPQSSSRLFRGYVDGPPDLAVEIVSPESVERDYQKKRSKYERARVREYWIIDELKQETTLLRLSKAGEYREVRRKKGALHSVVLPGFFLREEWLWQDPRTEPVEILAQIVSGKP
jgi:Uma2 family endonuclease